MNRALALTATLLTACVSNGSEPDQNVLELDHYLTPCTGWEGQVFCMWARAPGEAEFGLFYDPIDGLDFEWGARSTIVVRREPGDPDIVDAPTERTVLVEVRSTTPVEPGTEFPLAVDGAQIAEGYAAPLSVDGQSGRILDGPAFDCVTPDVCQAIAAALAEDGSGVVRFAYADPVDAPLVALAVE